MKIHSARHEQSGFALTGKQICFRFFGRRHSILHIAAAHGAEILILGAFGCGAFRNDPEAVAAAYRDALAEYGKYFDEIEFAVYCRGYETGNYDAFRRIFG